MNNNEVTEWCPNCDHEVTMRWDIHADGYKAFCPYCGNVLMPNDKRAQVLARGMSDERPDKFAGNGKKAVRRGGS